MGAQRTLQEEAESKLHKLSLLCICELLPVACHLHNGGHLNYRLAQANVNPSASLQRLLVTITVEHHHALQHICKTEA